MAKENGLNGSNISINHITKVVTHSTEFDYKQSCRQFTKKLFNSIKQNKKKVAQYIWHTGEIDTYESLLLRTIRTALTIKDRHLDKNDVICLSSYNHLNSVVPFLASLFLGIKVTSLDPSFTVPEVVHLIKLVKPKIFFIVPEVLDTITKAIEIAKLDCEIVIYGDDVDTTRFTSFNSFLNDRNGEETFSPVEIQDDSETAIIFFSSGTTGLPKGICNSYKAFHFQAMVMIHFGFIHSDSVFLAYTTLYWVTATMGLFPACLAGGSRVICKKFDATNNWYIIEKYKVTCIFVAPILVSEMLNVGQPENIDTSNLSFLIAGGSKFSENCIQAARKLLPQTMVCQAFGMTEIAGLIISFIPNSAKSFTLATQKTKSAGMPLPAIQYKVVNPDTEIVCDLNELGELRIKSEFMLNGYYNVDSSGIYDKDGWLKTGDVGYFDDDFCFFLEGRIKEMFKYKSWHILPSVLEQLLNSHPGIEQSVVIGIPHEIDGDHPMALIVLNKNYEQQLTVKEIEEFVNERVNDTHKLRGGVKFIDAVPYSSAGKIKRTEIRNLILKQFNVI